jgi:hypothetical protein
MGAFTLAQVGWRTGTPKYTVGIDVDDEICVSVDVSIQLGDLLPKVVIGKLRAISYMSWCHFCQPKSLPTAFWDDHDYVADPVTVFGDRP